MNFSLKISDDGYAAYLRLPGHPGEGVKVAQTVSLVDVMGAFDGPHIVFDFDDHGKMIGVEFVAVNPEEEKE
jgi:hypothetical protein